MKFRRHYCADHSRKDYRTFDASEGSFVRRPGGKVFLCHDCFRKTEPRPTPSPLERMVKKALDNRREKLVYKHEARIGKFRVDFEFPTLMLRVDIDSKTYHKYPPSSGETPKTREHAIRKGGWKFVHLEGGDNIVGRFFDILQSRRQDFLPTPPSVVRE